VGAVHRTDEQDEWRIARQRKASPDRWIRGRGVVDLKIDAVRDWNYTVRAVRDQVSENRRPKVVDAGRAESTRALENSSANGAIVRSCQSAHPTRQVNILMIGDDVRAPSQCHEFSP
jgi:hypothetical protein